MNLRRHAIPQTDPKKAHVPKKRQVSRRAAEAPQTTQPPAQHPQTPLHKGVKKEKQVPDQRRAGLLLKPAAGARALPRGELHQTEPFGSGVQAGVNWVRFQEGERAERAGGVDGGGKRRGRRSEMENPVRPAS